MDMAKYRALFVEEAREHLEELARLTVEFEARDSPSAVVDEIFRHVHSLKGMAATMGYDPIATLSHRLEDVVAGCRALGVKPDPTVTDCLLRGLDAVHRQIECIDSGAPLEQHLELLQELAACAESMATQPMAARGNIRQVTLQVFLTVSCAAPGVRAFLVHRRLQSYGAVVQSEPSVESLKTGAVPNPAFVVVLETQASDAVLQQAVRGIADVERVKVAVPSDRVAPAPAYRAAELHVEDIRNRSTVRVRTEVLDGLIDSVGELFISRERLLTRLGNRLDGESRAALDSLGRRIREVHDQVMRVRMTPMRTLTDRYPRLVRDLARKLHKEVELEVVGADIELDRVILDAMDPVLLHVLRNAVDHGVETPEARRRQGKVEAGRVAVVASRERDTVLVVVEDDGRGLDPQLLREHAVRQGVLTTEQAAALSSPEIFRLISTPGFSTRHEVSDVSGRGVGMDVVMQAVDRLGGSLEISSEMNRGCRFIFRLPLTLAIVPILLVESQNRRFALPAGRVIAVRERGVDVLAQPQGPSYLSFQHALVPITSLGCLLNLDGGKNEEHMVMLEDGRDLHALSVERVMGYNEVVVKPLGAPLDQLEFLTGAAVMGDGQPILILDVARALRQRSLAA